MAVGLGSSKMRRSEGQRPEAAPVYVSLGRYLVFPCKPGKSVVQETPPLKGG